MNVAEAVDELYRAHARYSRPAVIDYCPHCRTGDDVAGLLTVPLRGLGAADLDSYAVHLFGTIGGEEDFRYLLPRLLELLAAGEFGEWTAEVLLRKVCGRVDHPAFDAYLLALWHSATMEPSAFLREICAGGRDCTPFLDSWTGSATGLSDLVAHPHRCDALERWLAGPVPPRVLEEAVLVETDPDALTRLSHAYDLLEQRRTSR